MNVNLNIKFERKKNWCRILVNLSFLCFESIQLVLKFAKSLRNSKSSLDSFSQRVSRVIPGWKQQTIEGMVSTLPENPREWYMDPVKAMVSNETFKGNKS